jgi:hypothetical protein
MIEALLGELASAGGTEIVFAAGEHLVEKIKSSQDIKKLFVETGEFFIDFEPQAEQLFQDMAMVLSKENMIRLANEVKDDSGYTLKKKILDSLILLMGSYDIPRDYAIFYANRILFAILNQLPEVAPQQYDRYFQSEWREEQEKTLGEIKQKIEKVNNELTIYNKRTISIESADQLDIRIRKQTNNPRIGIEFFSIDDDNFKELFEEQKENEIVRVRAKCREEAIYCIVNELWHSEEKRAIFIVKSKEDWSKLSETQSTGNIYIPWFWANEICAIENNTNIFIYTDGIPSFSQEEIVLRPRTFHTISNALEKAGMGINEANALVNETHGLYIPMKKKIFNGQFLKMPKWMETLPNNVKRTCLLVGQWTDSDGDKEIVSELSGMKYEDFIDAIMPFAEDEDPFIHIVKSNGNRTFHLASVENTWEYMDVPCEDDIWKKFKNLFVEVLNESEKLFVYTPQERMVAQFKGERLFWSSVLRNGMIRSLIMKAYYKNDHRFQASLDDLISQILEYVQTEDQWKYISNFFIDLCEVAPRVILDRLFKELEQSTGLMKLFDTQTSDFILGKNCYIDILFGVDEFLVQDEYAARGYEWLLKLDDKSFEYKSNSPKDTIGKVLCSWCNFSVYKSLDDKVFAAKKALELDRNAWNYVFDALPTNSRSILGEIHKPKYRTHIETSSVTIQEMHQTVEQYVLLLIEKADFRPDRWGKLLGVADELSDELAEKIFSSMLFQVTQMSEYEQVNLKKQIRQLIYKHRYFASASWSMGEEKVKRFEELLDEIVIPIPEYEYAYLFTSDRNTILLNPVPYDEEGKRAVNDEKTEEIIKNKIAEFKNRKLDIAVLAEICSLEDNSYLGRYLALYGDEEELNQAVFGVLYKAKKQKGMALDYCQGMYIRDKCVFEKVFARKDELEFSDDFMVGLYRIQALNTEKIPLIDSADNHIKELFWNNDRVYIAGNYEWALKECRKYGSVSSYLELLYQVNRTCKFDNETLFNYLVDIHKLPHDNRTADIEYYLSELLKPLQDEYAEDAQRAQKLVEIEVHFFGILDWKQMKCFHNEIKRTPDTFAEIVSIVFKKDNNEKIEERTEEQTQFANAIYRLYDMAHFCPAENNGMVDSEDLDKWIQEFSNLLEKNNQQSLFGFLLGRLWSFSPVGKDNNYPCEAVRDAIENYADESMISEYKVALFNQRGIFSPSAGREERAIADRYKRTADCFKLRYPKTAEIFYGLYRQYIAEAEEERSRAENGHF